MKVLILGASGFVGFPTAQAFVRAGHEVYAQTRDPSKKKLFEAEEMIPVTADPVNGEQWSGVAEKVDVVIDCIGGHNVRTLNPQVFDTAVAAARRARRSILPKLTYVAISGVWMHGDDRTNLASERAALAPDGSWASWRAEHEQRVLTEPAVDGIVLRPSLLYGRSGALILGELFAAATRAANEGGAFAWPARAGDRWALCHVDDVAELFVKLAEASPICKGQIFEAANAFSESVDDVLNALKHVSGASSWHYREATNPFEASYSITTLLRPSLAHALIGWQPRHTSLVDGMKTYYASYKALAA